MQGIQTKQDVILAPAFSKGLLPAPHFNCERLAKSLPQPLGVRDSDGFPTDSAPLVTGGGGEARWLNFAPWGLNRRFSALCLANTIPA